MNIPAIEVPEAFSNNAETDESTPPDMATITLAGRLFMLPKMGAPGLASKRPPWLQMEPALLDKDYLG